MVGGQSLSSSIRIAAFHVEPEACLLVRDWAAERGHEIVLLVTTPGPPPRTYKGYQEIVAGAPPRQEILVTTRFRRAAPIIAAARPDLVLSYTFPYRLPQAMVDLAPLGAVNLHPAPLPRYRGPNPHRMIFDGEPTIGAALHRLAPEFDAGRLLAVREAPLPDDPSLETVRDLYDRLIIEALDEGVARAIACDPGDEQDDAAASYAASFEPGDFLLDWSLPVDVLRRRAIALNLVEDRALAEIGGELHLVTAVDPIQNEHVPPDILPGTIVRADGDIVILRAGDGLVRVSLSSVQPASSDVRAMPLKAPRHTVTPR
ncbi:MAG TPA: formyltransferase family protein [Thermomicrobiales bacterium]|nr:formyltransferase family protein [Thermomicrobiales bacterium]